MKTIPSDKVIYTFRPEMGPVATVSPGEVVRFCTQDCWSGQITSEDQLAAGIDRSRVNPATGPVFVAGAEPGDLLEVKILGFTLAGSGFSAAMLGGGVLGPRVPRAVTRIIPVTDGACRFLDIPLPARPMIGVIGVAPADADGECRTVTPWKHGGNMDTADIREGSTLYLPVAQAGALLAMGDVHAVMGDGEMCSTGCEIAAEITVKVDCIKGKASEWPLLATEAHTMVIASGDTLGDAVTAAADQAVTCLSRGLGLAWEDAYILASLAVDLRISQLVNPRMTVRAAIPRSILPTEELIRHL